MDKQQWDMVKPLYKQAMLIPVPAVLNEQTMEVYLTRRDKVLAGTGWTLEECRDESRNETANTKQPEDHSFYPGTWTSGREGILSKYAAKRKAKPADGRLE